MEKADSLSTLKALQRIVQESTEAGGDGAKVRALTTANKVLATIFGPGSNHMENLKQLETKSFLHWSTVLEGLRGVVSAAVDEVSLFGDAGVNAAAIVDSDAPNDASTVFVIHGRQKRLEVHDFLRAIALRPLEWSQVHRHIGRPNPYIWEVVDMALSKAGAIIALMTPDDEARLREDLWSKDENAMEKVLLNQPRQNVLFEAGVAYGRNPRRTILARIGAHRPMSDLAGHSILQLNNSPESRQEFADALRAAGCPVDLSGSDWFRAGNLE